MARSHIHPTAIVDPHAELGEGVEIGPYSVVGRGVRLGDGTRLVSHVVVTGRTTMGRGNVLHPFAVIGGDAQTKKGHPSDGAGERCGVTIGDENVLREHVTVNGSTGSAATRIGSQNLLMTGCHVAHDVVLGSRVVVANAVQLAGHSKVGDWATFGGLAGVAQFVVVGESAFVAAGAMCERDVPPFVIVQGDRARVRALNVVGLERRGVPASSIAALKRAFLCLYARSTTHAEALASIERGDPFVDALVEAMGRR